MAGTTRSPTRSRTALVFYLALVGLVLAGGCSTTDSGKIGTEGRGTSTAPEESVNISSTPPTEHPTTEQPRTGGRSVSISFPILVPGQGGAGEHDAKYQCVVAGWYGYSGQVYLPIPDDAVVSITGISFHPDGIFEAGGDLNACPGGTLGQACDTSTTFTSSHHACLLVVTQVAEADPQLKVYVQISATATCAQAASCEAIQRVAATGGEKVYFQAIPGAVSGTSRSTSPDTGTSSTSPDTGTPSTSPDTGTPSPPIESATGS